MFFLTLQISKLKSPLLLYFRRDELRGSYRVLSLSPDLCFQLMSSYFPVLHDLLGYLAATDTSARTITDGAILISTIELEIFDAF